MPLFKDYKAFILMLIGFPVYTCSTGLSEYDLHNTIFANYSSNVMPHENKSTPVKIILDMYLMSIDNIDEKRQTITIKAFLEIVWRDDYLTWDPDDYPGVYGITVKDTDIWIPDIALHDTFDKPTELGHGGGNANIGSDGMVTIWPYKMYTVACKISVAKFPFDKQKCEFDFLSWTHPSSVLTLKSSQQKPDMNRFTKSGEWDLTGSEVKHILGKYGNDTWDHVHFCFELQRKPLYHIMNVFLPVLCICILNVACFILPSEGGERVTLSISIFLTLAVFLTVVNSSMPETSDEVASFSVYVGLQLFGSAFTIMLTILSLNIFHKDKTSEVPRSLNTFVKLCCVAHAQATAKYHDKVAEMSNESGAACLDDMLNDKVQNSRKVFSQVTWKMVSRAMDRLCLISAVCWHFILIASLVISVNY